jgi:hypothetical protein
MTHNDEIAATNLQVIIFFKAINTLLLRKSARIYRLHATDAHAFSIMSENTLLRKPKLLTRLYAVLNNRYAQE